MISECHHLSIQTYTFDDGEPALWACNDCQLRFYPACKKCISIGHRGVEHTTLDDGLRAALEEAMDVGIYPASSPSGPRNAYQDGWNDAAIAIGDAFDKTWDTLAATPAPQYHVGIDLAADGTTDATAYMEETT